MKLKKNLEKMAVIDLDATSAMVHAFWQKPGGMAYEYRQDDFSQLMEYLPMHEFRNCVSRYRGQHKMKKFSCFDQFLYLAFAQLSYRESLRDIEACLRAQQNKLYHMDIRCSVSRNTLAHHNEKRDWRIYPMAGGIVFQTVH